MNTIQSKPLTARESTIAVHAVGPYRLTLASADGSLPTTREIDELHHMVALQALLARRRAENGYPREAY